MSVEFLKSVLNSSPRGPFISYNGEYWILFVVCEDPDETEIMCRHEDWNIFLELCQEYS